MERTTTVAVLGDEGDDEWWLDGGGNGLFTALAAVPNPAKEREIRERYGSVRERERTQAR